MTTRPLIGVLLLVAATACSGGDEAAPTTFAPVASTTPATTTPASTTPTTIEPPSTTTTAPSTTAATTVPATTSPATVPPTAPSSTTPLDPIEDLAAAIQRDVSAANDTLMRAMASPGDPANQALLATYYTDAALTDVLDAFDNLAATNTYVLPNPDVPSIIRLMSEPMFISDGEPRIAEVDLCRINSGVQWQQIDGNAQIVDDDVVRVSSRTWFALIDGRWRMGGGELLDRVDGATTCE